MRLYAALANNGELRPLRRPRDDPIAKRGRLLSPEAAFLTLEMLDHVPRPGIELRMLLPASRRSFGKRERRTVTATLGQSRSSIITCSRFGSDHFDGRGNPELLSAELLPRRFCFNSSIVSAPRGRNLTMPHLPPSGCKFEARLNCAHVPAICRIGTAHSKWRAGSFPESHQSRPARCHHEVLIDVVERPTRAD